MKRMIAALLTAMLCLAAAQGWAQIGFAEVARDQVNMREKPSGDLITRLESGRSVYIVEERTVGGRLWCHVYTYIGKNPRDGWIRGDMLRMLSEEFTDVMSVAAGSRYVLGIRSDGTVAIMGDDMPHSPCLEAVRSWRDIAWVCSDSVGVNAVTTDGVIRAAGKYRASAGLHVASISGNVGYPIGEDGAFMSGEWGACWNSDPVRAFDGLAVRELTGLEYEPFFALTADGDVVEREDWIGFGMGAQKGAFTHGPYVDIDEFWNIVVALRADGRVDATGYGYPEGCRTEDWENVVKVEAGEAFSLGLRQDGTVYFAGEDRAHAAQVEAWRDVVDIAAGQRFSVALLSDGSVVMAGEYTEEYFR